MNADIRTGLNAHVVSSMKAGGGDGILRHAMKWEHI